MLHKHFFVLFALFFTLLNISSCSPEKTPSSEQEIPDNKEDKKDGMSYVWDFNAIPEITINFSLQEWNELLTEYDKNNKTKKYFHCNVTYKKGADVFEITNAGVRLRGNTSRRRPEVGSHKSENANWQHCHFGLNLRKYEKDDQHQIHGIRKMNLKWFNNDPSYIREPFSFDLFERAGVWSASKICYARLWINVEGDKKPAYFGVYSMIEPYDNKYIERRADKFINTEGNLWKCTYTSNGPADLRSTNANFGQDDNINEYTYELKETEITFDEAKSQLQDFIAKLNGKSDESFKKWISEVCDVKLLLRTYAVNVALGMWDDHWNNGNNYYLYFDSTDKLNYKVYLLPYDYDNTLGTSNCYDPAKQNPMQWGNMGRLMDRMMRIDEFKQIYIAELKRLIDPSNGLMDHESATRRIKDWLSRIKEYISNDTGEDMNIEDKCASWSNYQYRLLEPSNNYFKVKAESINNIKGSVD